MTAMDPKTVEQLERKIEEAIAQVVGKMGMKRLPLLPSRRTMHLMTKAAGDRYNPSNNRAAARQSYAGRRPQVVIRETQKWPKARLKS